MASPTMCSRGRARSSPGDRKITRRIKPLRAGDAGAPDRAALALGPNGLTTGDAANELSHLALDPNVHIQESRPWPSTFQPAAGRAARPCAT